MKVVLELQDQPSNVKKVTVRHDIVIGRGSDCNLRLSAPQISRRHCFLRVGREGVSVTDLDSSNGTFVDGKRLKGGVRQELVHGSLLALGSVRFLIRIKEDTVAEDVLKPAGQKQSSRSSTSKHSSDSSTVIGDANALLAGSQPPLARPMGLSVEQAGAAADSHDVTADLEGKAVHPKPESPSQKLSSAPPLSLPKSSDSVAEIAEPVERVAAGDSKRSDSFGGKPDDVAQADFESRATIADAADLLPPEEFSRPFAEVAEVTETESDAADAAPGDLSFFDDHEDGWVPPFPHSVADGAAASLRNEDVASRESAASDWDFAEIVEDEAEAVPVADVEDVEEVVEVEEVEEEAQPVAVDDVAALDEVEVLDDIEPDFDDVEVLDDVELLDEVELLEEVNDAVAEDVEEVEILEAAEVVDSAEAIPEALDPSAEYDEADLDMVEVVDEVEVFEPEVSPEELAVSVTDSGSVNEAVDEIDPMDFLSDDFEPSVVAPSGSDVAVSLPAADAASPADEVDDFEQSPVAEWLDAVPEESLVDGRSAIAEATPQEAEIASIAVSEDIEQEPLAESATLDDDQFFDDVELFEDGDVVVEVVEEVIAEDDAGVEASDDRDALPVSDELPEAAVEEAEDSEPEVELDAVIEAVDGDASSWFAADDDDDADPELQKFLKGF